jgi:hypothetical protein
MSLVVTVLPLYCCSGSESCKETRLERRRYGMNEKKQYYILPAADIIPLQTLLTHDPWLSGPSSLSRPPMRHPRPHQ